MKAGIYLEKEHVEIRELPLPEVGDNDVHRSQGDCRR